MEQVKRLEAAIYAADKAHLVAEIRDLMEVRVLADKLDDVDVLDAALTAICEYLLGRP